MALIDEDDDFFGSQDDEDDALYLDDGRNLFTPAASLSSSERNEFGTMTQRELRAKQEELKKVAFLDAYDEYKESKLQEGFEYGMLETFDVATRIGKILGKATTLQKLQQKSKQIDPSKHINPSGAVSATDAVREFFTDTFQKENPKGSRKEELRGLEEKLETLMQQKDTSD